MSDDQMTLFSPPTVFGLYSPAMGSGKSEVAKVLVNEFGAKLIKFAGPLKDMTRVLLLHMGVTPSDVERCLEGDLKELPVPGWKRQEAIGNGPPEITPRRVMQTLGTEWRNLIDLNLWVRIAEENVKEEIAKGRHVVVDDLRFPHEYAALQALDAKFVRVTRPGTGVTHQHGSEGLLNDDHYDYEIHNDSSLDALRDTVRNMMKAHA
jgi:hypothetical protein